MEKTVPELIQEVIGYEVDLKFQFGERKTRSKEAIVSDTGKALFSAIRMLHFHKDYKFKRLPETLEFSEAFWKTRLQLNLSPLELGEKLKVSRQMIEAIEISQTPISLKLLRRFLKLLPTQTARIEILKTLKLV